MIFRVAIVLLLVSTFLGCTKEGTTKPYAFLRLTVGSAEEDIKWETVTGTWIDSSGNADLIASSYYFDRCKIHLQRITGIGKIEPLTLVEFYFTDGLDFRPDSISGVLIITEASVRMIAGTFNLYLSNNSTASFSRKITGSFGIVN